MANPAVTDSSAPPLYVVYQPVVRLQRSHATVHAYESLLRVGPNSDDHSTFTVISQAEQNGTMPMLDTLIARQVCGDASRMAGMRLWINLSQRTLSCPDASRDISELIHQHNLACRITIEMTETADGDEQLINESLRWFRNQQITVVIDDIDDGYAKSHLLHSELIAGCKLSRRSTVRLMNEPGFVDTASKLVRWCKANGKSVVMEGIENVIEYRMARQLGVDFCQGYYFWQPIPLSEVPAPGTRFVKPTLPNLRHTNSLFMPTYMNTTGLELWGT
ncbi:EAL domain-containing protein [Pseudomonas savastanoi]|uniref:EAL domain-containing protein n=1 Tax=Pseudomonas savastanoi TaxID=29438 RepID=UPI0013C2DD6E|nr:EAL domain-containing protein [Pseudomonas savastanoi]